jgi:hypothetical protein
MHEAAVAASEAGRAVDWRVRTVELVQESSSGRGAVVAHLLWEQGVPSSNLGAPTTILPRR